MVEFEVTMKTSMFRLIVALIVLFCAAIFVRTECVTFIDSYETGFMYNKLDGRTHQIRRTGYVFHAPFVVNVNTVDTRPLQVCINANARVLNCKLVQFDPAGLQLFLSWHGRQNYSQLDLEPILMAYAYEGAGHTYPFLRVLREIHTSSVAP